MECNGTKTAANCCKSTYTFLVCFHHFAVHTDCVFIDGRIASGPQPVDIEKIVRDVYAAAGYGVPWNPDPGKIRVTTDLCQEALPAEESEIRPFSDGQNIVIG